MTCQRKLNTVSGLGEAIEQVVWVKSAQQGAHESFARYEHPVEYDLLLRWIKLDGQVREFRGKKLRIFYFGAYKYWVTPPFMNRALKMGENVEHSASGEASGNSNKDRTHEISP